MKECGFITWTGVYNTKDDLIVIYFLQDDKALGLKTPPSTPTSLMDGLLTPPPSAPQTIPKGLPW